MKELIHLNLLEVSLFVEIREEIVEQNGVHSNPPDEGSWIVTIDEKQLEGVEKYQHELNL